MDRKKLEKLKQELAHLRRSPQKAKEIEKLAQRLGRRLSSHGKHPMWESAEFDWLYAISIPRHAGRDLALGTQRTILNSLEEDVEAWEERMSKEN